MIKRCGGVKLRGREQGTKECSYVEGNMAAVRKESGVFNLCFYVLVP